MSYPISGTPAPAKIERDLEAGELARTQDVRHALAELHEYQQAVGDLVAMLRESVSPCLEADEVRALLAKHITGFPTD